MAELDKCRKGEQVLFDVFLKVLADQRWLLLAVFTVLTVFEFSNLRTCVKKHFSI